MRLILFVRNDPKRLSTILSYFLPLLNSIDMLHCILLGFGALLHPSRIERNIVVLWWAQEEYILEPIESWLFAQFVDECVF
jgi:hypothetical protein